MSAVEKKYHQGDTIITEGHAASCLFVIRSGKVEVYKRGGQGQEVKVAELQKGEFFGEMSLLDPGSSIHGATVKAMEETTVAITERSDFDRYLGSMSPGMKSLLLHMVKKLRDTTEKLANLQTELDKKFTGK
jgi:CRP-like cAMP-binding protein